MKDKMVDRVCDFFQLDKAELEKLAAKKDLYSATAEMSGLTRQEVKEWMHGSAYGVGKESFKCSL